MSGALSHIAPGDKVAVATGSRGIRRAASVIRAVVNELRQPGAHPLVIAAMGSHGGVTADDYITLLTELGVTPQAIGAEVRACKATSHGPPIQQVPGTSLSEAVVGILQDDQATDHIGALSIIINNAGNRCPKTTEGAHRLRASLLAKP